MPNDSSPAPFDHQTVERFELAWLAVGIALLCLLFGGVLVSMVTETVPGIWSAGLTRVNVAALDQTEFARPGVREVGGELHAYVLARSFAFEPAELRVPLGREVRLFFTAADVQHSLLVPTTNINVQLIPGQVASTTHTFTKPGTFVTACGEYCGVGHDKMPFNLTVFDPQREATP